MNSAHLLRHNTLLACFIALTCALSVQSDDKPAISEIRLSIGKFSYVLHSDRLRIVDGQDAVLDVCLSPTFDKQKQPIQSWKKAGDNHFEANLGTYGKAIVRELHGRLAYWIETPVKEFKQ